MMTPEQIRRKLRLDDKLAQPAGAASIALLAP
jgi:hypothetical protein